jgi:hypothetical protein
MALNAAESNRVAIHYIPETVWGTTPASGTVRIARITSSSIVASKETETSNELRADRMVSSVIEVAASTSGDIEGELSAGTYDDFFQQFLLGAWTENMNHVWVKGTAVAVGSSSTITITSPTDYTPYFAANQWIKLEGFTDPENNRYVQVHASTAPAFAAGVTTITVAGTPLVTEAGSANTAVMDAGDVCAFQDDIDFSATGNTVTAATGTPFANLVAGQTVYMEGLDKGSGTVLFNTTDPTEGSTITVVDGKGTVVYEFRTDVAQVAAGNVAIVITGTPGTDGQAFADAVNAQFALGNSSVSATFTTATATLKDNDNTQAGAITTSDATAFTVTDFANGVAGNNGFFTVASAVSGTVFTTVETLVTQAAGATVLVKGSHLRNPGTVANITKQSMSIAQDFSDIGRQLLHDGMRLGSFGLTVEAGSIVTCNFSFQGSQTLTDPAKDLTDTATYTVLDTTPTEVMNATDNVGTIVKDGSALASTIMSIEMNGDNSLREQRAVGNKFPAGIGYGRFTLEGSIQAYFENFTLYNNFLDHDTVSFKFPVTDVNNFRMLFTVPAAKFTANPISPGGIDEDIMEEIEWTALRDSTLGTMFMIDRFSSIRPFTAA